MIGFYSGGLYFTDYLVYSIRCERHRSRGRSAWAEQAISGVATRAILRTWPDPVTQSLENQGRDQPKSRNLRMIFILRSGGVSDRDRLASGLTLSCPVGRPVIGRTNNCVIGYRHCKPGKPAHFPFPPDFSKRVSPLREWPVLFAERIINYLHLSLKTPLSSSPFSTKQVYHFSLRLTSRPLNPSFPPSFSFFSLFPAPPGEQTLCM